MKIMGSNLESRAAVTSIMRAIHIPSLYTTDYTWEESSLFVWTAAELGTTIIAASIPILRTLLRNIKDSTHRRDGRTGVTNTFKTGTYVCSTVGRSQSYRRMDGDTISQKPGGKGHLDGISESGESVTSLVDLPMKNFGNDRAHGGIMKTEEVQVQYDRKSWDGKGIVQTENPVLGFEMEEMPASYMRSESR